jgi:hypothetical protein
VFLTAALALGGTAVLPAAASADDEPIAWPLPIKFANSIVVDAAHQHVIIGDQYDRQVLVTDYRANQVGLLDLPSVGATLVLGDRLYVSSPSSYEILAYDTATLTRVAAYPLGTDVAAGRLVEVGGKIWFSHGHGLLGSLDPADSTVRLFPALDGYWTSIIDLEAVGDRVVITGQGISGYRIAVLDASTGEPTTVVRRELPNSTAVLDAALTPDGENVVLLGSAQSGSVLLRASDLTTIGGYAVGIFPNAVKIAADGTVLISDTNASPHGLAYFWPDGSVDRVDTVATGYYFPGNRIQSFDIVPGTHTAFAITAGTSAGHPYALQVYSLPAAQTLNGFLSAPSQVQPGQQFTIIGNVYAGTSPAGLPMEITRLSDGTRVGPTTVPAESFEFTDTAPASGSVTYRLRIAGNREFSAFTTETTVTTAAVPQATTLTLDHNGAYYNQGATVTFTAHLGSTHANRVVNIYADPAGTDPKRLLASRTADARGNATAAVRLTRSTLITATFAGDELTKPASASAMVYTRASVSTSIAKYYKKKGSYFVFHKKKNPVFTTTMTAYAKRKQYLVVEYYSGGRWRAVKSGYYTLTSAGKSTVTFTNSRKTGVNYRVRAAYLTGKSGDTVNATTYGAYQYFNFTK